MPKGVQGFQLGNKLGGRRHDLPPECRARIEEVTPKLIEKLITIAMGADKKTAISAIQELLDRGFGKSKQFIENDVSDNMLISGAEILGKFFDSVRARSSKVAEEPAATSGNTGDTGTLQG